MLNVITTMAELKLEPISFFIAVHKDAPLPGSRENYVALGIGGYRPANYFPSLTDIVGDSISHKNNHYSELTGWYWIWKNVTDVRFLGLCHYRRYFILDENDWWLMRRRNRRRYLGEKKEYLFDGRLSLTPNLQKIYFEPTAQSFAYLTAPERTRFGEKILSRFDVIVPRRRLLNMSLSEQYAFCHVRDDWDLFIQGIQELFPQYSLETKWFDETKYLHPYNMMIASKEFFDRYMSSLFHLLFWMEEQRPFRTDPYQSRAPSFLSERFFTFYLHVTGARYAEAPVAISDMTAD
jgi:hypothetical protein